MTWTKTRMAKSAGTSLSNSTVIDSTHLTDFNLRIWANSPDANFQNTSLTPAGERHSQRFWLPSEVGHHFSVVYSGSMLLSHRFHTSSSSPKRSPALRVHLRKDMLGWSAASSPKRSHYQGTQRSHSRHSPAAITKAGGRLYNVAHEASATPQ